MDELFSKPIWAFRRWRYIQCIVNIVYLYTWGYTYIRELTILHNTIILIFKRSERTNWSHMYKSNFKLNTAPCKFGINKSFLDYIWVSKEDITYIIEITKTSSLENRNILTFTFICVLASCMARCVIRVL